MTNSTPVVLFGADSYCALGVARSLGRLGIDIFCIDKTPSALAMKSRYCTGRFIWDFASQPRDASVEFLISVTQKIDRTPLLIAMGDTLNLFVDEHREQLSGVYVFASPTPGVIARLYNKRTLFELCGAEGIPTPNTLFPHSLNNALSISPRLRFPLVVKGVDPDRLMRHTGELRMAIAYSREELPAIYQALDEPAVPNLALQEFIKGDATDNWVVSAYFDRNANCRFAVTGIKLRQLPIQGGVSSLVACSPCQPIVDRICQIAKAAGYHGALDADFLYDATDDLYKLLDINPRLGANFRALVDRNGLSAASAMYLDLTGQALPAIEPAWGRRWVVETKDFWALRELLRTKSISLGEWIDSLKGVSECAYWASDDIRPALRPYTELCRACLRAATNRLLRRKKSELPRQALHRLNQDLR